ncbi:heme-degrading domain-containing protein [Cellulomonas sp. KRMCY2]|uniref:heme-degrading domain-containing protein n=1 Tax=Cellulomonas sp. KRMCY2 TaxID=1304865 RepID=UPI00045EA356|nr:heme-degrading domain-containing protein [Cellulomonas sp. KRMCY2]
MTGTAAQDSTEIARLIGIVTEQQHRLQLTHFDNDDAWRLGCLLVELGRERRLPIVVDVRRNGHQLFHASLPGTTPDNDSWVERKVRVVNRFGAPSYLLGLRSRLVGSTFEQDSGLPVQEYAAHGGSFPITVKDVGIVGTVTVSGLPQAKDHALVVEALEGFLDLPHLVDS